MTNAITIIAVCTLLALLTNLPMVFRERRLRKLAFAKLEVTRTVNDMNVLMLAGQIKLGEPCHDRVYPVMVATQFDGKFNVTWNFLKPPSDESKKLVRAIHEEISKATPLGNILKRFSRAKGQCFRHQQPLMFICFSAWVMFVGGGLIIFLMALVSFLSMKMAWTAFRQKFSKEKATQMVCEWLLILGGNPDPQFRRLSS